MCLLSKVAGPRSLQNRISPCLCFAGQSVDHHFLTSYYNAILSIILTQFSPKGLPGGMQGIIKLAQASPYLKVSQPACHRTAFWQEHSTMTHTFSPVCTMLEQPSMDNLLIAWYIMYGRVVVGSDSPLCSVSWDNLHHLCCCSMLL